MAPRRVLLEVAELDVESQQYAVFPASSRGNFPVGSRKQILFGRSRRIVSKGGDDIFQMPRKILVQLELHGAQVTFQMLSRESSAA